jgi:serine phosphatase RsbU (regulator of sigma subunit)
LINTESGELTCSCAGGIEVLLVRESGAEPLPLQFPSLGTQPDDIYRNHTVQMNPGDVLVVIGDVAISARTTEQRRRYREELAVALQHCHGDSSQEVLDQLSTWLTSDEHEDSSVPHCALVVRRK